MVDVLAFGAHPDDVEFECGGILAKEAKAGRSIVIVDLTLGDKGTHGSIEERREEGKKAAALIGAKRETLDFADCEVMDSYEGRLQLTAAIRRHQPRLVLAPMACGAQNHPDHLACGKMARYACRYARFAKIMPEVLIHRVDGILHYPQSSFADRSDFLVDISDFVEVWKEMILCHQSQMQTLPYLETKLAAAAHLGTLIGASYAQGLIKGNPIQIDSLLTIAQGIQEL